MLNKIENYKKLNKQEDQQLHSKIVDQSYVIQELEEKIEEKLLKQEEELMNFVNAEKNKKAFFDSMKKGNPIKFSKEK